MSVSSNGDSEHSTPFLPAFLAHSLPFPTPGTVYGGLPDGFCLVQPGCLGRRERIPFHGSATLM